MQLNNLKTCGKLNKFGFFRTGNHAFCRELDALVPEHWHLINDRDAVPRSGKFFVLYKRAGQRVLLNQVSNSLFYSCSIASWHIL